ncbi:MAG: methyltransferase domain-containing protein [Magnetococcales bacterium]|nr:methyltransferase domain-containing protein [Magnetococcales bacterium]
MTTSDTLDPFLAQMRADIYPEPPSEPHLTITHQMIAKFVETGLIAPHHRVLDVGCGSGLALEEFARHRIQAIGVTLGPEAAACREKGFDCREMDVSFLEFPHQSFHAIWCRHTLEHSFSPLFTLYGFEKILISGGLLYVEVPAPDTACHHEKNPNHYYVMGKSMWESLFEKTGFIVEWSGDFAFDTRMGPDLYWSFVLRKKSTSS